MNCLTTSKKLLRTGSRLSTAREGPRPCRRKYPLPPPLVPAMKDRAGTWATSALLHESNINILPIMYIIGIILGCFRHILAAWAGNTIIEAIIHRWRTPHADMLAD